MSFCPSCGARHDPAAHFCGSCGAPLTQAGAPVVVAAYAAPAQAVGWSSSDARGTVTTIAGCGRSGFKDGPALQARFNRPHGIAVAADGTIYVADRDNDRIRAIAPSGYVSTFAGPGSWADRTATKRGRPLLDGQGSKAGFRHPEGIAVDPWGNVVIGEDGSYRLRFATPDAAVTTLKGATFTFQKSMLHSPVGLATDASGAIYVADSTRVMMVSPDRTWTVIAGDHRKSAADGPADNARYLGACAIALSRDGVLYLADRWNQRICYITPDGMGGTLAGTGKGGYEDGPAATARFHFPSGVAVAVDGTVYVSDEYSNRIRAITPDGMVSTIAGDGRSGWRDGPADVAQFKAPRGLAIDPSGALLVCDRDNHCIRRIVL